MEKNKRTERMVIMILSVILVTVLSVVIFHMRKNSLYHNRDRIIILCHQTNINGSDGEEWAKKLSEKFTDVPDFEVSTYLTQEAGNENMTITSENGWSQIVIRLAANEGDILLIDNKTYYETLLKNGYIVELTGNFESPVTDENGTVYGVDVTGLKPEGLLNYNTSQYVGNGQPLPIKPAEQNDYLLNGLSIKPRVIAVIYKGSTHIEESQTILNELFGKEN